MDIIRSIRNVLVLLVSFFLGVVVSYAFFVDSKFLDVLVNLVGGNILSPIAILLSAAIASTAAYAGLRDNNERHLKEQTIKLVNYKRFTWPGIRKIIPTLNEISTNYSSMSESQFDEYMHQKRSECDGVAKVVSFLDSYQSIAFGINNEIYHEKVAKLIMGRQLCFIYENSKCYIEWRRSTKLDGPASHSGLFQDLEKLAGKWDKDFA